MTKLLTLTLALALAATTLTGCLGGNSADDGEDGGGERPATTPTSGVGTTPTQPTAPTTPAKTYVAGKLTQAGSSTVLPIALAWAEILAEEGIEIAPQGGGSGAGASKICAKEVDIGDMSRAMKQSEIDTCRKNGVEPQVWKVAFDGITVVVNKQNTWVDYLTVAELKKIWNSTDHATTWADVRASWPAEKIVLYGPDSDSGTYEYFNEEILGTKCKDANGKSVICPPRSDYNPSPDDNILVNGVAGSKNSLGYFGFAYYKENADKLKAVPIAVDAAAAKVSPSLETIRDGSYKPLARPIYMVTNGKPAAGTTLASYFDFGMGEGQSYVEEVGYVPLDDKTLAEQRAWLPS